MKGESTKRKVEAEGIKLKSIFVEIVMYIIRHSFLCNKQLSAFALALCLLFLQCGTRHYGAQPPDMSEFRQGIDDSERVLTISDQPQDVIIHINSPRADLLKPGNRTRLIFFALPNGNSIEWTAGKKMLAGNDWHYDIQHIAAQTRYLRSQLPEQNIITVYLATRQKSWPAWKRAYTDYPERIQSVVNLVTERFQALQPRITLNSHSGGGSFIFGYLDGVDHIPGTIDRLAFIDSSYGYEEKYGSMITRWLREDKDRYLNVLAYNDSVVVFNGKPLVSPTGGTWYRSKLMQRNLSDEFRFDSRTDTGFIRHRALNGRVQFVLKQNPGAQILHTQQVANNGFIFTNVSGSREEKRMRFAYWGDWAYREFISEKEEGVGK